MTTIRIAQAYEAELLSDLAFASKAYWGYSDEFMANCRDDLQVPTESCDAGLVSVAVDAGRLVGYYRLSGQSPDGKLDDLFVDPTYIGKGVGRELIEAASVQSRKLGFTALEIHSDPNAENFYLHIGAKKIGETPSGSIPSRMLPLLTLNLQ